MVNLAREQIWGEVEVDETWVTGTQAGLRGSRQIKGRKAALVLVAVERRGHGTGRIRMAVIPDFKRATLIGFLKQNVALGSTVYTDGLKSFTGLRVWSQGQHLGLCPYRWRRWSASDSSPTGAAD